MELRIKDRQGRSIVAPPRTLATDVGTARELSPRTTAEHLQMLGQALRILPRLLCDKLPQDGGRNPELQEYLYRLAGTMDVLALKHRTLENDANRDVQFPLAIQATHSGFPLFTRDLTFLENEKAKVEQELADIPPDVVLVQNALYALFADRFPTEVVAQKLQRNYLEQLGQLDLPQPLRVCKAVRAKKRDGFALYEQSVERLDDTENIPKLYTIYFRIPEASSRLTQLFAELDRRTEESLGGVSQLELTLLADRLEAIDGIQVEGIDRYDIGPFFNLFTQNPKPVQQLLADSRPGDALLTYRKLAVQRVDQKPRAGLGAVLKAWFTGDDATGEFGPAVSSPNYVLMPHRLIQRVHDEGIDLGRNVRMYGMTHRGDLVD